MTDDGRGSEGCWLTLRTRILLQPPSAIALYGAVRYGTMPFCTALGRSVTSSVRPSGMIR